ncbi:MAG TPA: sigma 54-interacting transcriptional regulator [Kofleriaceae bacterium]
MTQAKRDREAPLRISLQNLDEVKLSRTAARCIELRGEGAPRTLRVGVADNWMSLDHATLVREVDRWTVRDYASKNGTKINGQRWRTATLRDGDVVEMGRTFFVFRAEQPTWLDAPQWFDSRELEVLPGLATMVFGLADRFGALARLATTSAPIVIQGPAGCGKELLARAVHMLSGRRGQFVAVNCAGLSEAAAERELFGAVRRAIAGANCEERGLIAASAGGTLFLDEIADLSPALQSRLLRVLQHRTVRPTGAAAEIRLDLRVVAATRRDLVRLVEHGNFRYDLLDRLGSLFCVPPLCERREDLGLIIEAILERIAGPRARDIELSVGAMRGLMQHAWPGDVRELQAALERAVELAELAPVEIHHLPTEIQRSVPEVLHRAEPSNQLADRSVGTPRMSEDAPEDPITPVNRASDVDPAPSGAGVTSWSRAIAARSFSIRPASSIPEVYATIACPQGTVPGVARRNSSSASSSDTC